MSREHALYTGCDLRKERDKTLHMVTLLRVKGCISCSTIQHNYFPTVSYYVSRGYNIMFESAHLYKKYMSIKRLNMPCKKFKTLTILDFQA